MSDGPHRSLPMRPAWRRVAERGDKRAFTLEEISQALAPSLFRDDVATRMEALRPQAGAGIGRAVLDNVGLLSAADADGFAVVQEALKAALIDRANRGARQVE